MRAEISNLENGLGLVGPALHEAPSGEVTLTPPGWLRGIGIVGAVLLVVWCVVWDLGSVALQFQETTPLAIRMVFPLVGAGMTLFTLRLLLVRHAWKVCPGRITRRTHVLLTGLVWENHYKGVDAIEFRRGVWKSGKGHTDVLRFRVRGRDKPVNLDGLSYDFDESSHAGEWVAAKEEREQALGRSLGFREMFRLMRDTSSDSMRKLDVAQEEREQALGRFLAERVGVLYAVVEETVPDPSSD